MKKQNDDILYPLLHAQTMYLPGASFLLQCTVCPVLGAVAGGD